MQHKALRLFIQIFFWGSLTFSGFAQNLTQSPYSIIGVGEQHYYGGTYQSAMGQLAQGIRRQADINVMNPASFSALRYTVIDAGVYYANGTLSTTSASSGIRNYSFSYFMFGVPLSEKRKAGLVFGLSPYSNIGYKVANTNDYGTYTAKTLMTGNGGLTRFHVGAGAQVIKNLSLGVNANYLFGQTRLDQRLIIPTNYYMFNVADIRTRNIGDVQWQLGAQYYIDTLLGERKEAYTFVIGAAFTMGSKLNAYEDHLVGTMAIGESVYIRDTILNITSHRGDITLPYTFSGGISFEKKENWLVGIDINYTNWSSYRSFGQSDSLKNMLGLNIGASYIPNASDYKSYMKRIEYRAGARYDNGNLNLRDKMISTYGISAGIGLPLGKTKSRLNISAEYFVKGTQQNNLIREEYFRIVIGANFSDRWFQRYKYD